MKKRFFAEQMGRIHMTAVAMSSLALYLRYRAPKDILVKQIQCIQLIDDDNFWQKVSAENILRKAKFLQKKIEEKMKALALEITKSDCCSNDDECVMSLWLSCVKILSVWVDENFAHQFYQSVVNIFIANIRSFDGDDYLDMLDLLSANDRDAEFEILSESAGLSPEEFTTDEIVANFEKKYHNLQNLN